MSTPNNNAVSVSSAGKSVSPLIQAFESKISANKYLVNANRSQSPRRHTSAAIGVAMDSASVVWKAQEEHLLSELQEANARLQKEKARTAQLRTELEESQINIPSSDQVLKLQTENLKLRNQIWEKDTLITSAKEEGERALEELKHQVHHLETSAAVAERKISSLRDELEDRDSRMSVLLQQETQRRDHYELLQVEYNDLAESTKQQHTVDTSQHEAQVHKTTEQLKEANAKIARLQGSVHELRHQLRLAIEDSDEEYENEYEIERRRSFNGSISDKLRSQNIPRLRHGDIEDEDNRIRHHDSGRMRNGNIDSKNINDSSNTRQKPSRNDQTLPRSNINSRTKRLSKSSRKQANNVAVAATVAAAAAAAAAAASKTDAEAAAATASKIAAQASATAIATATAAALANDRRGKEESFSIQLREAHTAIKHLKNSQDKDTSILLDLQDREQLIRSKLVEVINDKTRIQNNETTLKSELEKSAKLVEVLQEQLRFSQDQLSARDDEVKCMQAEMEPLLQRHIDSVRKVKKHYKRLLEDEAMKRDDAETRLVSLAARTQDILAKQDSSQENQAVLCALDERLDACIGMM